MYSIWQKNFNFHPGPVFVHFVLADEINRSPAKTHAALLEVMAEGQVTIDGKRYVVPKPFIVMATQNPIENEGTYALPEAQLDRFLYKVILDYPQQHEEEQILSLFQQGKNPMNAIADLQPVLNNKTLSDIQAMACETVVDDQIITYITQLIRKTRDYPGIDVGASPRAGVAILASARAVALMAGRNYVMPEDIMDVAIPALRHRVVLTPEAEIEGVVIDNLLRELCREVPVPRGKELAI